MVEAGRLRRSVSWGPAVTSRWRAVSVTDVVSAPYTLVAEGWLPGWGMRPKLGLKPTRPQNDAGMRIDPPPSDAVANGTIPAATAAAEPPLEPPGVRAGSQGFRVTPHAGLSVTATAPNSGLAVLPTGMAPA